MKRFYETAIILIGTLGWWSYVYPELTETQQAYVQEAEADMQEAKPGTQKAGAGMQETKPGTQKAGAGMQETKPGTQKTEADLQKAESDDRRILKKLGGEGIRVGEICIKSRIAEYVYQVKEETLEKGAEDD